MTARAYPIHRAFPSAEQGSNSHPAAMHIRDWPASERPREKLLKSGPGILSDAELLALFLGSGPRGCSAVEHARRLLAENGALRCLLDRSAPALAGLPGIGPARACALAAALELGRRHLEAGLQRGALLSDPGSAGAYLASRLRGLPHEEFAVLFLDTRHRLITCEVLFRGSLDGAEVHPREVLKRALAHNAAAVILGHNHPSGNAEPSAADRAVTQRLKQALALVEVRLLDHLVIGDGSPVSMAERGWL